MFSIRRPSRLRRIYFSKVSSKASLVNLRVFWQRDYFPLSHREELSCGVMSSPRTWSRKRTVGDRKAVQYRLPRCCVITRNDCFACNSILSLLFFSMLFAFVTASSGLHEARNEAESQVVSPNDTTGGHRQPESVLGGHRGGHRVDLTEQKIVSRLTSQEMDEKYWLDSSSTSPKSQEIVLRRGDGSAESPRIPDGTRIITIPMSAVPPRLQSPGSSRGMPPRVRIVEIDHSQKTFFQKVFRRAIHSSDPAPKKKIFSVDLHGGIIGVGEYYSVIELGNKRIRVQVDTGSSTLAGLLNARLDAAPSY